MSMRGAIAVLAAFSTAPLAFASDKFPAAGGDIEITPIIHSSLQIEHAGKVIHVDPWSVGDLSRAKPADLILITDDVGHHLDVKAIQKLRKPGAPIIIAANGKAQVPDGIVLANGQSTTAAGVRVESIAAYDIKPGAPEHPKGQANGYVITLGGRRIYFAGVTECVPEVKALKNIDVAFMPMNIPVERMMPADAAACTKILEPKAVYVYHYDQDFASLVTNPNAKPRGLPGGNTVAQSLQQFRDAMKGTATTVMSGDWYPTPAGGDPSRKLPVVWVLATGGTISGRGASSTSLTEYSSGSLLGEELVKGVPEIAQVASVKVEQIANVSSTDITTNHWLTFAKRINGIFDADPGVAGVVVTHGTNTLEETAYFLNLTVRHERPVVLVGAMRPSTAISADGPLNLLNGIRTAASADARGKGVLVVLNDEINSARDVTKTSTYRVETFRAPELGLLGYVDGDRVSFYRSSTRRHTAKSEFDVSVLTELPKTDIVYSYVEPSTAMAQALVAGGVRGIVFAGTGAGMISTAERGALKPILSLPEASRPVLVRSNRTGSGRVVAGRDYDAMGMIAADTLNPQKARILLMLALTKTRDPAEIRRMFGEY